MKQFNNAIKSINENILNINEPNNEDAPYIEIAYGQIVLDVEGKKVKVVYQKSGDIDFFDMKGNVYDSDSPHFDVISNFATSFGS